MSRQTKWAYNRLCPEKRRKNNLVHKGLIEVGVYKFLLSMVWYIMYKIDPTLLREVREQGDCWISNGNIHVQYEF